MVYHLHLLDILYLNHLLVLNLHHLPVFAYQVSGEYSLIETAIAKKLINKDAIYESLVAFKRAGANAIVSYYADRIDKIIK